jgi:nucleotide-binding universal stress UspA family protein
VAAPNIDAVPITTNLEGDMNGSIICGVDDSTQSRVALRVAARLSDQLSLPLIMAHASQLAFFAPPGGSRPVMAVPISQQIRAGQDLLDRVAIEEGLVNAKRRALYGLAAERLAHLADEENAELIVVGSRRRGALKSAFLGSVSRDLISMANRPVLVVPRGVVANGEKVHRAGAGVWGTTRGRGDASEDHDYAVR